MTNGVTVILSTNTLNIKSLNISTKKQRLMEHGASQA